jgi:hypothetical protein
VSSASPPGAVAPTGLALLKPQPAQTLACIGTVQITGAVFAHWVRVARHAEGRRAHPRAHALIDEAMGFLISSDWVLGESQRLGISVSPAAVRQRFERIRRQQFPHTGEFAHFLKRSGQTIADLLFRVRLNLLSSRIQQRAGGQLGTFVSEFRARWRSQTFCAAAYAISDCGHVQAAL